MTGSEEKKLSFGDSLRAGLYHQGRDKMVALGHGLEARYWTVDQVERMIKVIERKLPAVIAGIDEFNELENLALWVLTTSAGIDPRKGGQA